MMKKAYVYVDGFNLYYGALKCQEKCRWLNIRKLCSNIYPYLEIEKVKYFTANPGGRRDARDRHDLYLRALQTDEKLEVILGKYAKASKRGKLIEPWLGEGTLAKIVAREEKKTDVNIATHMLYDAQQNEYDTAVVITNDSDLVTPIDFVRGKYSKDVFNIRPILNNLKKRKFGNHELKRVSTQIYDLNGAEKLRSAQFPEFLSDMAGPFQKPDNW